MTLLTRESVIFPMLFSFVEYLIRPCIAKGKLVKRALCSRGFCIFLYQCPLLSFVFVDTD